MQLVALSYGRESTHLISNLQGGECRHGVDSDISMKVEVGETDLFE